MAPSYTADRVSPAGAICLTILHLVRQLPCKRSTNRLLKIVLRQPQLLVPETLRRQVTELLLGPKRRTLNEVNNTEVVSLRQLSTPVCNEIFARCMGHVPFLARDLLSNLENFLLRSLKATDEDVLVLADFRLLEGFDDGEGDGVQVGGREGGCAVVVESSGFAGGVEAEESYFDALGEVSVGSVSKSNTAMLAQSKNGPVMKLVQLMSRSLLLR